MIQSVAALPPESAALAAKVEPASSGSPAGSFADGSVTASAGGGATSAAVSTAPQAGLHTNPVSVIDVALGLVVLQFYNQAGVETQSIPTKRQLAEYALHAGVSPAVS